MSPESLFDAMMAHFAGQPGGHPTAIRGIWDAADPNFTTNLDRFNAALAAGLDEESAAIATFTGRMAAKYHYTTVRMGGDRPTDRPALQTGQCVLQEVTPENRSRLPMHVDPQVVTELRSMFLNGATPWRLVRHIANRHESDPHWSDLVGSYFAEAFSVTTIAMDRCPLPVDLDGPAPAHLDDGLLRDMVGRAHLWRSTANGSAGSAWFDELSVATDDLRMVEQIHPESHPALADSWASLPSRVKSFLRQSMVNAQGYHERLHVLAKLVERLQQQIVELELHREEANA